MKDSNTRLAKSVTAKRKPSIPIIWACGLAAAIWWFAAVARAQTTGTADSVAQLAADTTGLAVVPQHQVPILGTFWWVDADGTYSPKPFGPPAGQNLQVRRISNGHFLVDASATSGGATQTAAAADSTAAAIPARADALITLISKIQTNATTYSPPPAPGSGGSSTSSSSNIITTFNAPVTGSSYPTNSRALWLEITGVANGHTLMSLHNATNRVYAIWSATNLRGPWQIEREVWPQPGTNQPVVAPFAVRNLARQTLFFRAEDWTSVTENGNTTPDWWFWENFGTTALADSNLDPFGQSLLTDYQLNLDPNPINFVVSVTNNYNVSPLVPVQLVLINGAPAQYAVTLDAPPGTNRPVWQEYAGTNLTVNLGQTEGWHQVWIGLRGHSRQVAAVWQPRMLHLDVNPPVITLTNPAQSTVNIPRLQIKGYSSKALAGLTYSVSNAAGQTVVQSGSVTDQYYDPAIGEFTTNYFECLDVPLAVGTNLVTVRAWDLAGLFTQTNFTYRLDYSTKTNPPVFTLLSPMSGWKLCGTNFTVRGTVDDPTVSVTATIRDLSGHTNTLADVPERNGKVWVENLPLRPGTNFLSVSLTDAVGHTTTTNLFLVQSALAFTLNEVSDTSQLWQPYLDLSGTISDATLAVWVNGVKGHNNGDGTWNATRVPTTPGGTASFSLVAYEHSEQQPDGSFGN